MDLADHLRTIVANWWRILVISTIVAGGVYAWSRQQPDTFSADYLITVAPEVDQGRPIDTNTLTIRVLNEAAILQSPNTAAAAVVAGKLDAKYHLDAATLQSRLTVITVPLAGNILIKTEAHSPQQALDQARALGLALQQASIDSANAANDAAIKLNQTY